LRLFLKLAAEARYDPAAADLGLEPLPDIDFNIRAGNSLVGFASMAEFDAVAGGELVERRLMREIVGDAEIVQMADKRFRELQEKPDQSSEDLRREKRELAQRLGTLNQNMHRYLAKQYGVDDADPAEYAPWMQTHRPFHWLAEFYGIIEEAGGFDVVIGNPPYIEYAKVKKQYTVKGYKTESCELANTTPKVGHRLSADILAKICKHAVLPVNERGDHRIYFHNAPRYWTRATDFVPYFWNERDGEKQSTQVKTLAFSNRAHALAVCALLNSSLFYWWFLLSSDCRHLNMREIENFPFNPHQVDAAILDELATITGDLMADYRRHATRKEIQNKNTGKVVYDEFHPGESKAMMDRIDIALAKHYRFTEVELDYLINYDIKYRMGGGKGG